MLAVKPGAVISLEPRPSMVGGALPRHKMPSISRLPIVQVILDNNGDDEEEKGARALRR